MPLPSLFKVKPQVIGPKFVPKIVPRKDAVIISTNGVPVAQPKPKPVPAAKPGKKLTLAQRLSAAETNVTSLASDVSGFKSVFDTSIKEFGTALDTTKTNFESSYQTIGNKLNQLGDIVTIAGPSAGSDQVAQQIARPQIGQGSTDKTLLILTLIGTVATVLALRNR